MVSLNPLKAVPPPKLSKLSSKPKEIIDLGTISLGSYQLSPPSPSVSYSEPLPPSSPLSPPVVRHMTPAQLLDELRQKDIAAGKYVPPQRRRVPSSAPVTTRVSIIQGCFYCHNKHGEKYGSLARSHYHRNKCPWFQHHLAVGTCHLNDVGELCLGPKLVGRQATPLPFWDSSISQGEQIKLRMDGTEFDEVVEKRLRNPVVFGHRAFS
jgi:hypothetical protein